MSKQTRARCTVASLQTQEITPRTREPTARGGGWPYPLGQSLPVRIAPYLCDLYPHLNPEMPV